MLLRRLPVCVAAATFAALPAVANAALYITIVQGLGGQPQYDADFVDAREKIVAASESMTDKDKVASFTGEAATRDAVMKHFSALSKKMTADDRAALYLVGHGSFDGETYKFNIAGPDLTAADFRKIVDDLPGRNHFIVNTSSTSGAMLETLVGKGDDAKSDDFIVIAATRNGNERNATHFGRYFAEALTNKEADLNKNNSVSVQEAFDYADQHVTAFFEEDGKLATEHPQLRGDGAAQFNLARLNAVELQQELATADAGLAELLQRRAELDVQIEDLQVRRNEFSNADYLSRLQTLILQSAELAEQIDAAQKDSGATIKPELELDIPAPTVPAGGGNAF